MKKLKISLPFLYFMVVYHSFSTMRKMNNLSQRMCFLDVQRQEWLSSPLVFRRGFLGRWTNIPI